MLLRDGILISYLSLKTAEQWIEFYPMFSDEFSLGQLPCTQFFAFFFGHRRNPFALGMRCGLSPWIFVLTYKCIFLAQKIDGRSSLSIGGQ
jgi:hypothetical protein